MNAEVKALAKASSFTPPPLRTVKAANRLTRFYFNPQFQGLEHVDPLKPALYVCNHTLYGMLDGPLLYEKMYEEKGIVLRALGDHFHFKIPLWGKMLKRGGSVAGTRENCAQLMEQGEHILVYPGGGREVAKRRGEKHKLTWKTRTGFAHMAMKYQYPIIPVAALGADDALDIVVDAYDVMQNPLGRWLLKHDKNDILRGGDMIMPLCKGIGPTILPRPEKFYFSFGKPIDSSAFLGMENDKEMQWQLRYKTMQAIEAELSKLREVRKRDKDNSLIRRLLTQR
ncbi:MAG: acyltransferase family protein [Ketobacter sp.]|nr:acyltransferase family protein [Ketobacter sp.]